MISSHLPPDWAAIGDDFPQVTTWQGKQLIETCIETDLTPANIHQGGEGTNNFGIRIEYVLIAQRRLPDLRVVKVDQELEERMRHIPSKIDHYPISIHFEIPPWPIIKRQRKSPPPPKLNQHAPHAIQSVPEDNSISQADLDEFIARFLSELCLHSSLSADDHYYIVNSSIWQWAHRRFVYKAYQKKPWISDQCWDLIVKRNDVATETSIQLNVLKRSIRQYFHPAVVYQNIFYRGKFFVM